MRTSPERRFHRHDFALERLPPHFVACARRSWSFREKQDRSARSSPSGSHKMVTRTPGPVLFHLRGCRKYIERSSGKRPLREIAIDLRAHVVDIGFDHGDRRIPIARPLSRPKIADQEAQYVRASRRARPNPRRSRRPAASSAEFRRSVSKASWRWRRRSVSPALSRCRLKKSARRRSNSAVAGAGTGSIPCAVLTLPGSHVEARTRKFVDAEKLESDRRADNVDDRIDRAHFMEMNFLDGI